MIGLRSLRNRLAVVFGLIVLGAIGTIYLTVTPRLEERLRNQKVERLLTDAQQQRRGPDRLRGRVHACATRTPLPRARASAQAAASASAEVLILRPARATRDGAGRQDGLGPGRRRSTPTRCAPLALEAGAHAAGPVASTDAIAGGRYAVVAYPLIRTRRSSASRCSPTRSTRSRATSR